MTNTNNKKKNNGQQSKSRKGNPVSFMPRMTGSSPMTGRQRVFDGKDIISTSVTGVTTFGLDDFLINPRLPTFPGAALIAQRYDMYQFESLEFCWHPTTAVTTTPGVVFMAWEPNANHADLGATISVINAMEFHTECPVYQPNCSLRIPKSVLGAPRYLRAGPIMGDLNLYDTGRLLVARGACADTAEKGYVEVYYRVKFYNYHLEEPSLIQNRVAELILSAPQGIASTVTGLVDFDILRQDFGGWEDFLNLGSGVITLPRGTYQLQAYIQTYDDTSELFTSVIRFVKNGSALSVDSSSTYKVPSTGSDEWCNHVLLAVVESDGTDTFGIQVTMTGAAGSLDVRAQSRLIITALN
jgi:hypothetical protein